jgi:plastocyanin
MNRYVVVRTSRPTLVLTVLVALFALVVSCGGMRERPGSGGAVSAPGLPNTIVIDKFAYQPVVLTVTPGARVTVINQDPAAHTVTAKDKSFNTGSIAMGQQGVLTAPSKPGIYPYYCAFHAYMTGTLIVK